VDARFRELTKTWTPGGENALQFIQDAESVMEFASPLGPVKVMKHAVARGRSKYFITVAGKVRKTFYDVMQSIGIDEALTDLVDAKIRATEFSERAAKADKMLKLARSAPSNIAAVTLPKAEQEWNRIVTSYTYPQAPESSASATQADMRYEVGRRNVTQADRDAAAAAPLQRADDRACRQVKTLLRAPA
jgi:hypothetical protein